MTHEDVRARPRARGHSCGNEVTPIARGQHRRRRAIGYARDRNARRSLSLCLSPSDVIETRLYYLFDPLPTLFFFFSARINGAYPRRDRSFFFFLFRRVLFRVYSIANSRSNPSSRDDRFRHQFSRRRNLPRGRKIITRSLEIQGRSGLFLSSPSAALFRRLFVMLTRE